MDDPRLTDYGDNESDNNFARKREIASLNRSQRQKRGQFWEIQDSVAFFIEL